MLSGCGGGATGGHTRTSDPRAGGAIAPPAIAEKLDPGALEQPTIVVERYGLRRLDLRPAARALGFRSAADRFASETGAERVRVDGIPGAVGFRVASDEVDRHLGQWHEAYLRRGVFVMRYEANFGYARDALLVLPTTSKWTALDAAGTDGVNWDISHRRIVTWLRRLDRTRPFTLTGAGIDYVEGRFDRPIKDALPLARRMYRFCPDIVDQGTGSVRALAREIEQSQSLYLWWD